MSYEKDSQCKLFNIYLLINLSESIVLFQYYSVYKLRIRSSAKFDDNLPLKCSPGPASKYATTQTSRPPDSLTITLVYAHVIALLPLFLTQTLFGASALNIMSNEGQARSVPSLFSNLGSGPASTPQPQTGGLFSNLSSSRTTQQPSIFSNLGGGTTSQPSSNAFSGLGSSQPQPTSGTGGLFGASTATTSQPQTTSLFASLNNPTSQPPQSSIFASQPPQQQQQNQPSQPQQDGQQLYGPTGTPQPAYFDSLLERGKKRTNGANGVGSFGELPSLQLGLGDISRRARELGGAGGQAKHGRGQDTKT